MSIEIDTAKHIIRFAEENGWELEYDDVTGDLIVVDNENGNEWRYTNDGEFRASSIKSDSIRVTTEPTHENDAVRKQDLDAVDGSNVTNEDFEQHDHDGSNGENSTLKPTHLNADETLELPEYLTRSDSGIDSGLVYIDDENRLVYRRDDT